MRDLPRRPGIERTHVLCISRQILHYWTTREAPPHPQIGLTSSLFLFLHVIPALALWGVDTTFSLALGYFTILIVPFHFVNTFFFIFYFFPNKTWVCIVIFPTHRIPGYHETYIEIITNLCSHLLHPLSKFGPRRFPVQPHTPTWDKQK